MTQWYIKQLSKLTRVSVRTLHHYDRIDLLKPSVRLPNGYRLYSEKDLLKLQQILALKFFGFELFHIKTLMTDEINILDHFRAQQKFLQQRIQSLHGVSQTIEAAISVCDANQSFPWETVIKLIEDYQMTKEIENVWVKKVLNPSELKEYAQYEQDLKARFTAEEAESYHQQWEDLVKEIQSNLDKDPTGDFGKAIAKRCMDWVNTAFTRKHATLRHTLWHKGFKGGYSDVPDEVVVWLDKATSEYYKQRIYGILNQVGMAPSDTVLRLWEDILTEMCGNAQDQKDAIYDAAMADDKISQTAKNWLQSNLEKSLTT